MEKKNVQALTELLKIYNHSKIYDTQREYVNNSSLKLLNTWWWKYNKKKKKTMNKNRSIKINYSVKIKLALYY